MGLYVGDQNQVVFQYESGTYANISGAGHWIGLVTNNAPVDDINAQIIRYAGLANRNRGLLLETTRDHGGTITYHPQDWRMYLFALGSCVDGGSPSPYTHIISELNNDGSTPFISGANNKFPSFTIVDSKKTLTDGQHLVRTHKGCIANSLSFKVEQGGAAVCELNYMAQSMTVGSKLTDIPAIADQDLSRPVLWSDVSFHLPSGTVIDEITGTTFTINNNANRRHYDNGSAVVQNITPENRDYEVVLNMDASSTWGKTFYETYFLTGSLFNAMLQTVISVGSEQAFIIMSGCRLGNMEAPSPAEGINQYTVTISPQTISMSVDDLTQRYNLF